MLEKLSKLIFQVTKLDPDKVEITRETDFVKDLGMDSITLVSLVFLCEKQFDIPLSKHPDTLSSLTSVGKTLDFFEQFKAVES